MRGERENKCHHESLGYWETRAGGTGIRRKIITSVFFRERTCNEENESEIVQKTKEGDIRASFVGHGCTATCFWVMEAGENRRSITRPATSPLIHFHLLHPHSEMPTELPYAADAEDSLSYDELQVRLRLSNQVADSADTLFSRSSASNTKRRYHSRT